MNKQETIARIVKEYQKFLAQEEVIGNIQSEYGIDLENIMPNLDFPNMILDILNIPEDYERGFYRDSFIDIIENECNEQEQSNTEIAVKIIETAKEYIRDYKR